MLNGQEQIDLPCNNILNILGKNTCWAPLILVGISAPLKLEWDELFKASGYMHLPAPSQQSWTHVRHHWPLECETGHQLAHSWCERWGRLLPSCGKHKQCECPLPHTSLSVTSQSSSPGSVWRAGAIAGSWKVQQHTDILLNKVRQTATGVTPQ